MLEMNPLNRFVSGWKFQVKLCPLNRLMCRFRCVIGIGAERCKKAEKSFFEAGSMGRSSWSNCFWDF